MAEKVTNAANVPAATAATDAPVVLGEPSKMTHQQMLRHVMEIDLKVHPPLDDKGNVIKVTLPDPADLTVESVTVKHDDAFGGNDNNRKVATRAKGSIGKPVNKQNAAVAPLTWKGGA